MKKFLSLSLVLILVLSLGLVAFADEPVFDDEGEYETNCFPWWPPCDPDDPEEPIEGDMSCITIKKEVEVSQCAVSPKEDFKFKITRLGDAPSLGINTFTISLAAGETEGSYCIPLPTFETVGLHKYRIEEIAGNTAGMEYDGRKLILSVYSIYDEDDNLIRYASLREEVQCGEGEKTDLFINKFNSGNLEVKKSVRGNFGDRTKTFTVKVRFTLPQGKKMNNVKVKFDGSVINLNFNPQGVAEHSFDIKHNQEFLFENLPKGMSWYVSEIVKHDHIDSYENRSGSISKLMWDKQKALVINTRTTTVDTGINLDSAPYIMILAGAFLGLGAFTRKKKY